MLVKMSLSLASSLLPAFAIGSAVASAVSINTRQQGTINGTVEYTTQCKTCPYDLCPNVNIPWGGDAVVLTCWTEGALVGDTELWLKTTDNCFLSEYDLIEYAGDFRAELEYCGEVEEDITRQDATVRYLSECKWAPDIYDENILFYGRDADVELTCWAEGWDVVGNIYWYKTTDNCHVSGSGLWGTPDRASLDWCGPAPGPRANETRRSLEDDIPTPRSPEPEAEELEIEERDNSLVRRWLQPEIIGEEYAPCRSCPSPTCRPQRRYEFNDTVVSQCTKNVDYTWPNGTSQSIRFMLTTDWCYVEGWYFWVPPLGSLPLPTMRKLARVLTVQPVCHWSRFMTDGWVYNTVSLWFNI